MKLDEVKYKLNNFLIFEKMKNDNSICSTCFTKTLKIIINEMEDKSRVVDKRGKSND